MSTAIKHRCEAPACGHEAYASVRREGAGHPRYVCLHHYLPLGEAWRQEKIRYDATRLTQDPVTPSQEDPLREVLQEYGQSAQHPQAGRYGYW